MQRQRTFEHVAKQVQHRVNGTKEVKERNTVKWASTGSTLLDLAISGGRIRGGGIPSGILVEIFGPASTGKTVLLCELAGCVQRRGGRIKFYDPEGRLDIAFSRLFDLELSEEDYFSPNTPIEIFKPIRKWDPQPSEAMHGIFADSLAALVSDLELEDKKDEYSRRAKLFSQELRKTCRVLSEKGFLLCCSNQIRANVDAGPFEEKFNTPGGQAIKFYASLRLRVSKGAPFKIKKEIVINGKKEVRIQGIKSNVEVYKTSIWKPYRSAPIYILNDYGIDDIRSNLQFIKERKHTTKYLLNGRELSNTLDKAIQIIEEEELEFELREETIDVWEELEQKFDTNRVKKRRVAIN